jgi:hypothetical protein
MWRGVIATTMDGWLGLNENTGWMGDWQYQLVEANAKCVGLSLHVLQAIELDQL